MNRPAPSADSLSDCESQPIWFLATVTTRDTNPVVEYSGETLDGQISVEADQSRYPMSAVLRNHFRIQFQNSVPKGSISRVVLLTTVEGKQACQSSSDYVDFRREVEEWTGKPWAEGINVDFLLNDFENPDPLELWNQLDALIHDQVADAGLDPVFVADLSGLGKTHSLGLSAILKTRDRFAESRATRPGFHAYCTSILKGTDSRKAKIYDLNQLDQIDQFRRAVSEFQRFGEGRRLELLLEKLNHAEKEQDLKKSISTLIRGVKLLTIQLRNGLVFNDAVINQQERKKLKVLLEHFENARPELTPTIQKTLHLISSVLPMEKPKKTVLNDKEFRRQFDFSCELLRLGRVGFALANFMEVVFSRVIFVQNQEKKGSTVLLEGADWLDRGLREISGRLVGKILDQTKPDSDSDGFVPLIKELRDKRNTFAHAANKPQDLDKKLIESTEQFLCENREKLQRLILGNEGVRFIQDALAKSYSKRILLTPLGKSPGVLFTLLSQASEPFDEVVILTSRECADAIEPALQQWRSSSDLQAATDSPEVKEPLIYVVLLDELAESDQVDFQTYPASVKLKALEAQNWRQPGETQKVSKILQDGLYLQVNTTGGLTAFSILAQRLAKNLTDPESRELESVFLVDRRSSAEQQENPWVAGEVVRIDEMSRKQ